VTSLPSFPTPLSLSPSRIGAFESCPLKFRFVNIEKLPDPPTIDKYKGTIVHRILELLLKEDSSERTSEMARHLFDAVQYTAPNDEDFSYLQLTSDADHPFWVDVRKLVDTYFTMEDPTVVKPEAMELRIEHSMGEFKLTGIIDRLERDENGNFVIVDYKTGKSPAPNFVEDKMKAMMLYAWLCKQEKGSSPAALRLLFLKDGKAVETRPLENKVDFQQQRVKAIYGAIKRSCETGQFGTKKGPLCNYCDYRRWCPEFGGDPARAAQEAPVVIGVKPT